MRINPISTVNYSPRTLGQQVKLVTSPQRKISFNGVGGSVGSATGALVGIGLGILTGGLGAILIGAMACCGIGGAIGDSADKNDSNSYEYMEDASYKYD